MTAKRRPSQKITGRIGRPRNRPATSDALPRDQILDAAAGLFEKQGFRATTTRQIAAAVGLEQGSLFHYFPRKGMLLAELLDRTLAPAAVYAAELERLELPVEEKLFLLVYQDTLNICSGPWNLGLLMHLPETRLPEFASFWERRLELKWTYRAYILEGCANEVFPEIDAELATEMVFGMVESCIEWFLRGKDDADDVAKAVARAALRLLVCDLEQLEEIAGRAKPHIESGSVVTVTATRRAES